jgi:nicotinate-nucleotide adenylyltransferase
MAPLAISASEIRARVARGEDVSAMVPAKVLGYIRQHNLYR